MPDSHALLPTGMMDQLPATAERESLACERMKSIFARFGYRLVNPPMLEFEETMLAEGAGLALSTNTFRLMDPVSRRMMALRSDTTAQIARIAASSLKSDARPLRLSYIADVLRINPTQLRPERQFKQAGCEYVGGGKTAATEIALIALLALDGNRIRDISIDFTAPEILRALAGEGEQKEKIMHAVHRRDRAAFRQLGVVGKTLAKLDELSGPAAHFSAQRKSMQLPAQVSKTLDALDSTIRDLKKALKAYGLDSKIAITVDPLEMRGFEYQSFPCFTLFAKNVRGELGRGGSYLSQFGDYQEQACGFTLYMDSVLRALPEMKALKILMVPESADWADIRKLQKDWNIVRCAGQADDKKAAKAGATHILKNGKVKEVS